MNSRAQGAIEYLLIIATMIFVMAILILVWTDIIFSGSQQNVEAGIYKDSSFSDLELLLPLEICGKSYPRDSAMLNGLVEYIDFEKYSTKIAADGVGNNYPAVCSSDSCPLSVAGPFGKAAKFDGVNDYFEVSNFIDANSMRTIAFWVNFDSFNNLVGADGQEIVSKSSHGNGTEVLIYNGNLSYYNMGVGLGAGSQNIDYPIKYLSEGTWYFITATQTPGATMSLYLNGTLIGSKNNISNIANSSNLKIGMWSTSYGLYYRYFYGTLDGIAIWTRELSQSEITELYLAGKTNVNLS